MRNTHISKEPDTINSIFDIAAGLVTGIDVVRGGRIGHKIVEILIKLT